MDDDLLRETIVSTITEQMTRLRKDILNSIGRVTDSDCGCVETFGCCREKGCCGENSRDLDDMIEDRYDILAAFIRSNREPIVKYFRERGVILKL